MNEHLESCPVNDDPCRHIDPTGQDRECPCEESICTCGTDSPFPLVRLWSQRDDGGAA